MSDKLYDDVRYFCCGFVKSEKSKYLETFSLNKKSIYDALRIITI